MSGWSIPRAPLCALWLLERAGFAAYIVGGCVRDACRGVSPHDWDVTTAARPEQMLEVFGAAGYATVPTGIKHGTVSVLIDTAEGRVPVECTTYRIDGDYTDARHPDRVSFTDRIADDLARRDFTVNAMAARVRGIGAWEQLPPTADGRMYSFPEHDIELIDLHGGREDLSRGCLRCVGEPLVRFSEDALRILRGVRFCVQLGMTPDAPTRAALADAADGLSHVSRERVAAELVRMLSVPDTRPSVGLALMSEAGLWKHTLPALLQGRHAAFSNEKALFDAVDALPPDAMLRLALLLSGVEMETARTSCCELRLSGKQTATVCATLSAPAVLAPPLSAPLSDGALRRYMATLGEDWERGLWLCGALDAPHAAAYENARARGHEIIRRGDALSVSALAVDGRVLMTHCGVRGREVGALLERLLAAVLEHPEYNERETLLSLCEKYRS